MNNKQIEAFCDLYYSTTNIPLKLFDKQQIPIMFFPNSSDQLELNRYALSLFDSSTRNPDIQSSSSMASYGLIKVLKSNITILIGPVFSTPIQADITRLYMRENHLDYVLNEKVGEYLSSIPTISYNQFVNILAFLYHSFNNEKIDILSHFNLTNPSYVKAIEIKKAEYNYNAIESMKQHSTYDFELRMFQLVSSGNVQALKIFLNSSISRIFSEGILADTPLRQSKNIFLGLVSIVGKIYAINGGLNVEQTYQLIDLYSQECESLQTMEAIKLLQYNMLIDFTERVSRVKIPKDISRPVFSSIQYIYEHINESIRISDISEFVGLSQSYLSEMFKNEMGINLNAFIIEKKLEEAKILLSFSEREISEISNYLSFSSQSYFQNVFKKKIGITPRNYRNKINEK